MSEAVRHHAVLDLVRSANADGERALADHDFRAAARAFTTALDHLGDLAGAGHTADELAVAGHLGLGRVHLAGNDYAAADLRFDQVQRLRPTSPEGFYWAGCTAAHVADYRRAEWLLNAALDRNPRYGRAYLQRAYVRLRQRRAALALPDLLAAADHQVTDDNARLLTAALLVWHGDAERAAAIAAGMVDSATAAAILGMARYRQGRIDAAAAAFERAVAAGCYDEAVLLHHGLAGFRRGDHTTSIAALRRLRDSSPHHDSLHALVATAQYARAVERLAGNDFSAALDDLRDAASVRGDLASVVEEVHLHDAASAIARGDWQSAGARLRGGGPRGLRYLAVLEFRDGKHAAAEQLWAQALRTAPADPVVRLGLAMSAVCDAQPADADLRHLCTEQETPGRIRRAAGRAMAALHIRRGDWSAAMNVLGSVGDTGWPAVRTEESPLIMAVTCVLGGRRASAAAHLARAAALAPADHRISHAQAVLHLHTLSLAEHRPSDDASWRSCIGAWVSVLHDETFWARWRKQAQRRYRCPVSEDTVRAVRTALDELIEQRLPSDELALLLRRERAAAAALARLGGLPDPDGTPLVCGPLRIVELGLRQRLSEFLLGLPTTDDDTVLLFRQFSEIGLAMAQLAAGRPRAAATAALDLRCASCARTGGRAHPAIISEPLMCEPECPEFDTRNPAFCAFADKHDELAKASVALAARTLLDIARDDITKTVMDLADARTCWRGAVTLAKRFNRRDAVLREIVDDALGRARVLSGRGELTGAIRVLDAALAAIPTKDTKERGRVVTELGFLLNARGVGLFNEDVANIERAHEDLRRAVTLSPNRPRPRLNLAVLLREMSYRAFDHAEGIRLLTESVRQLEIGAITHDTEEFHEKLEQTRQELGRMLDDYDQDTES
jgi:tetratricopeptide (TPR) repeat protein